MATSSRERSTRGKGRIMEAVTLLTEPELRNPSLIAAWPGMGGVAIIAARYLKDKLGAEELGDIKPYDFFDLGAVSVRDHVVGEPEFPESKFYFWKSGGEKDLIIFLGEAQPSMKGYQLANLVLDVAQANRVYTFAAAPAHIYHTRRPNILGAATHPELIQELQRNDVIPMAAGTISGLNGLLLGVAREKNMEGICLLGEIPVYTTPIPNPKSSKAVLEVLTKLLDIEVDLAGLEEWAGRAEAEIEENIQALRESHVEEASRLLDYFDQLKQASAEEEIREPLEISTEELLADVERFLRRKREEGN
jgi:proteasome assembly chaperone (PAC2) family protein